MADEVIGQWLAAKWQWGERAANQKEGMITAEDPKHTTRDRHYPPSRALRIRSYGFRPRSSLAMGFSR